ncbi:hypothetical protein ACIG47_13490 [Promicromonospora sp. NPDC052451]|uniref:hypothetical protein n=1 Tax=Promicromonospora sp. NPDC052451 TaxID=3364407 RepID=UPI0037C8A769
MGFADIKDLVEKLSGTSWDRVLAGFVYGLASGWFWWAVLTSTRPRSPLDGLTRLLETLAITPPAWISGAASWISHPGRAGLVFAIAVGAGLAATIYTGIKGTGSAAVCVILTMAALQGGGGTAVMITLATIAIPAGLSALLALVQNRVGVSAEVRPFEALLGHHTGPVTVQVTLTSLFPLLLIPFAPLVLVVIVMQRLSADRPIDEAAALSYSALHRVHTGSAEDQRVAAPALILAGALLTDPHDNEARQAAASSLRRLFTGPTGAAPVQPPPRV